METRLLSGCDLHVHLAGSFYAEDLLAIGAPIFRKVDWTSRDFLNGYNTSLETDLNPIQLFAEALADPENGFPKLKAAYVFDRGDSGDFERFMWKLRLFSHLWGYGWEQGRETAVAMIRQAVERHKRQGLDYVEYRAGFWGDEAELKEKRQICAEALAAECDAQFTARYIVPLSRPIRCRRTGRCASFCKSSRSWPASWSGWILPAWKKASHPDCLARCSSSCTRTMKPIQNSS